MIHPASAGEERKQSRSSGIELFHQARERRRRERIVGMWSISKPPGRSHFNEWVVNREKKEGRLGWKGALGTPEIFYSPNFALIEFGYDPPD